MVVVHGSGGEVAIQAEEREAAAAEVEEFDDDDDDDDSDHQDHFLRSVSGGVFADEDEVEDDVLREDVVQETVGSSEERVEDNNASTNTTPVSILSDIRYNRHKPKWWKQRVGRYVTKPQRRAMEDMQAYRLNKPPYGSKLDFANLFDCHDAHPPKVWMEIGFGKGDNFLCLAQRHPDICFVGIEVHPSGVAICLQHIQGALERNQLWTGYQLYHPTMDPFVDTECSDSDNDQSDAPVSSEWSPRPVHQDDTTPLLQNVCIYGGDGIVLLESSVVSHCIDTILITFPDPFPSDKPHRILQVHTVETMVRCLRTNGGRLCLATDHAGFFDWAHQVVNEWNQQTTLCVGTTNTRQSEVDEANGRQPHHHTVLVPVHIDRSEWLPVVSRYERKGWEEGRKTLLQCWETRTERWSAERCSEINTSPRR